MTLSRLFEVEPPIIGTTWARRGQNARWKALTGQDVRLTPLSLFAELDAEFHFTIDVAALPDNALCKRFFSPDDDGLKQAWAGERCWLNPPYSTLDVWTEKAASEKALTVGLLPVRTDLAWFHDNVLAADAEVRFIRGRLRFGGPVSNVGRTDQNAPFPNMIVVWRNA